MNLQARRTMPREVKGPVMAPPVLADGELQRIVEAVASWPGIEATVHWHLVDRSRVDGVDFYLGREELGHLHLDGSIHLATSPVLATELIAERLARSFPYQRGWVEARTREIGADAAIALVRRNYDYLQSVDGATRTERLR